MYIDQCVFCIKISIQLDTYKHKGTPNYVHYSTNSFANTLTDFLVEPLTSAWTN